MTKRKSVPDEDHVVRFVPYAKLRKNDEGQVIGVLGEAFRLRVDEDYLSSSWLEFFDGNTDQRLIEVKVAQSKTHTVGAKSGFSIGNVLKIKNACRDYGLKIRIEHEPTTENESHAAIRQFRSSDDELLDLLASEVWAELYEASKIKN
jgi:hypothetical protein